MKDSCKVFKGGIFEINQISPKNKNEEANLDFESEPSRRIFLKDNKSTNRNVLTTPNFHFQSSIEESGEKKLELNFEKYIPEIGLEKESKIFFFFRPNSFFSRILLSNYPTTKKFFFFLRIL